MSDQNVTIKAIYQQLFRTIHLYVAPDVAGSTNEFKFENHDIELLVPAVPEDAASHPPGRSAAVVFMWDANRQPLGVEIGAVRITIKNLEFNIPEVAAEHPHINATLYTPEQTQDLSEKADRLYFLARRAMQHWLRIVWWKTGYHLINSFSSDAQKGFDGGALINEQSGTRFYSPRVGRTILVPATPLVTLIQWNEIAVALQAGSVPPVWHEYLTTSHRRMESGDGRVAILDLAIAAEARIRTYLDNSLPQGTLEGVRKSVRRQNITDILNNWTSYGLPDLNEQNGLKSLFEVRNRIMHNGDDDRVNRQFFDRSSASVIKLLDSFGG